MKTPNKDALIRISGALRREKFNPGIDGMTASQNYNHILLNGDLIEKRLSEGNYTPKPALLFAIVNRKGRQREVCRFTAMDVTVQRALTELLADEVTDGFSKHSFAYITGRGRHAAAAAFIEYANKYRFAARIDPKACFDNIDRELLYEKLESTIGGGAALELIRAYAECSVADEKGMHKRARGILQGSPLSPILMNIYFHELDMLLESCEIPFVRYADDLIVFARSEEEASERAKIASDILTEKLRLELNTEKLMIARADEFEYLGFVFARDERGGILASEQARSDEGRYDDNWTANRFAASPKTVNILSNGLLSRRELALMFEPAEGGEKTVLPAGAIEQLNVFSSVTFAPQVIKAAFDNGIRINIFDKFGELLGRFEPASGFRDINVPLNQLELYIRAKGMRMYYARDFLISRNHNIMLNLRYQRKTYKNSRCTEALAALKLMESEMKACKTIEELLLIEARMQGAYYSCFDEIIKNPNFAFEKRTRRPPKNELNAMISFGNTFLYNYIATAINKTSLDIRIAYLHATNRRRESLDLDIADVYKPLIVDRTIFSLINKRMIAPVHFAKEENGGVYLTNAGKKLFVTALHEKLASAVSVGNELKTYAEIIRDEINTLCADIRAKRRHKSFRQLR